MSKKERIAQWPILMKPPPATVGSHRAPPSANSSAISMKLTPEVLSLLKSNPDCRISLTTEPEHPSKTHLLHIGDRTFPFRSGDLGEGHKTFVLYYLPQKSCMYGGWSVEESYRLQPKASEADKTRARTASTKARMERESRRARNTEEMEREQRKRVARSTAAAQSSEQSKSTSTATSQPLRLFISELLAENPRSTSEILNSMKEKSYPRTMLSPSFVETICRGIAKYDEPGKWFLAPESQYNEDKQQQQQSIPPIFAPVVHQLNENNRDVSDEDLISGNEHMLTLYSQKRLLAISIRTALENSSALINSVMQAGQNDEDLLRGILTSKYDLSIWLSSKYRTLLDDCERLQNAICDCDDCDESFD